MPNSVAVILPNAVQHHIIAKHGGAPYPHVLAAVKAYTKTTSSAEANAVAGQMAVERGCTKTDIYRAALVAWDNHIADLWPSRARTPGDLERSRKLMAPKTHQPANLGAAVSRALDKLQALRADLPTLNTRRTLDRLAAIIRILETQR